MVETIQSNGLWHVSLVQRDLIEQAGLKEDDFDNFFTHFEYKGRTVIISHQYKQHLVVSMEGEEDNDFKELMDGFSKTVEYEPFCKYILRVESPNSVPLLTYEWDKIDSDERYEELGKKSTTSDLKRLER